MTRWIFAAFLTYFSLAAALAAPVALVTDLTGGASLGEGETARGLEILDELDSGAVVMLESGAAMSSVYLASGDEYRYTGPAQVYFREDQPVTLDGAEPQRVALLDDGEGGLMGTVGVAQAAMVMRSAGSAAGTVELLSPVNTRVLSARPDFRWTPVAGSVEYHLVLEDSNEQTVWSATVDESHVVLPAQVHLVPGARYTWRVSATGTATGDSTGAPSAWANFRVSGEDMRAEVESRRPADDAAFSRRLLFAIWLQDQGLREEAQPYWDALSRERPDSRSLQALAGN